MFLRNRCGAPKRQEKAASNPTSTLDKYETDINEARRYWKGEAVRAIRLGNKALFEMGEAIGDCLTDAAYEWNLLARSPNAMSHGLALEKTRRKALGALGVSELLRLSWPDGNSEVPLLVDEDGKFGTVLDMIEDSVQNWQDFRVHTPIAMPQAIPEGAGEQWYKEGELWIRQVRPAEPTDYLRGTLLPSIGIAPDFSRHETLFPYVAAR